MSNLSVAYAFVAKCFENKFDQGGSPYFEHCQTVMHQLGRNAPESAKIAALCHDIIEDIPGGRDLMLQLGFSMEVIEIVEALSKIPGETIGDYKKRVKSNNHAVLIKMSDLRHNSDIRRLKGLRPRDITRTINYQEFYTELQDYADQNGLTCWK